MEADLAEVEEFAEDSEQQSDSFFEESVDEVLPLSFASEAVELSFFADEFVETAGVDVFVLSWGEAVCVFPHPMSNKLREVTAANCFMDFIFTPLLFIGGGKK